MSYVEERFSVFDKYAKRIFSTYAASYKEKEALYLKGTHFLKITVHNGLVEMMARQLRAEMDFILEECRLQSPHNYKPLKLKLTMCSNEYISRFRSYDFEADFN